MFQMSQREFLLFLERILFVCCLFLAVGILKSEWETLHLFSTVGVTEGARYYVAWESSCIFKNVCGELPFMKRQICFPTRETR